MNGRYLTPQEYEGILEKIRADKRLENVQELLAESRKLGEAEDSISLAENLPFRMFCETQYGKKEGYQEIIRQFQKVKEKDYDRMIQGACQGNKEESLELAYFLSACADTLEVTSMEIYEHYRYLADLMRETMLQLRKNGFFKEGSRENLDKKAEMLFGKAILKGCQLKVLLQEKYEKIGQDLMKN